MEAIVLSANPMWEQFGTRTLFAAAYGAADFGECLTTMARIGDDGDSADWHREWRSTATRLTEQAATSESGGHEVSAREAYLRAALCHRTSYQPLYGTPVDPRLRAAFDAESDALAAMVALSPDLELVEIPFENGSLPGLFARPDRIPTRGTIIYTNGYDSDLTEMLTAHVPPALARGYAILLYDGPGQGRNLIRDGHHLRPDWETVVGPVVDWALDQPGVDPDRLVLAGWSLGGFLAPRAAAFEHRLAALIADPGQWDLRDGFIDRLPLTGQQKAVFPDGVDPHTFDEFEAQLAGPDGDPMLRWTLLQRGLWVHGQATLFDYFVDACRYRVSDVAGHIGCPTLLTQAEHDPLGARAEKLYAALTVDRKALIRFTAAEGAGGHCETTARRLFHERVYDWLDDTLD
ncbi:MAG: alpha/beta fold hydrolase [Actinocatenispora sp.]